MTTGRAKAGGRPGKRQSENKHHRDPPPPLGHRQPVSRGFRFADVFGFEVTKCVDVISWAILCCDAGWSKAPMTGSSP